MMQCDMRPDLGMRETFHDTPFLFVERLADHLLHEPPRGSALDVVPEEAGSPSAVSRWSSPLRLLSSGIAVPDTRI